DPDELVPDLEIAHIVDGELPRLRPRAQPRSIGAAAREELSIPRERIDHPRAMRMEKLFEAEPAVVVREAIRGFLSELEVPLAGLVTRQRFELDEQRRHQIERDSDARALLQP